MRIGFFLISLILGILSFLSYMRAEVTGMTGFDVASYTSMIPVHSFWLAFIAWFLLIIRYIK